MQVFLRGCFRGSGSGRHRTVEFSFRADGDGGGTFKAAHSEGNTRTELGGSRGKTRSLAENSISNSLVQACASFLPSYVPAYPAASTAAGGDYLQVRSQTDRPLLVLIKKACAPSDRSRRWLRQNTTLINVLQIFLSLSPLLICIRAGTAAAVVFVRAISLFFLLVWKLHVFPQKLGSYYLKWVSGKRSR